MKLAGFFSNVLFCNLASGGLDRRVGEELGKGWGTVGEGLGKGWGRRWEGFGEGWGGLITLH